MTKATINVEYNIGDKVYVLFKEERELWANIFASEIDEIAIRKDDIIYYVNGTCEEFRSHELLPRDCDANELVNKINELLKESDKDE